MKYKLSIGLVFLIVMMSYVATTMHGAPNEALAVDRNATLRLLTLGYPNYVIRGPYISQTYKEQLENAGFEVQTASLSDTLSLEYLKQFNVIILYSLPAENSQYYTGGQVLAPYKDNMELVKKYMADGGGVVLMQGFSEHCEAMQMNYNRLLNPLGASFFLQQLREPTTPQLNPKTGNYESGKILSGHQITEGLESFLYPTNVLRFDDAYSTVPIEVDDNWQILARGSETSGTHKATRNSFVGPRLTDKHDVFAIRSVDKGYLAISGVHFYYTLTRTDSKTNGLSENHTGIIDEITLNGESDGRKSDYGKLLENTYRFFGQNSITLGYGGASRPLPQQPAEPPVTTVVDWHDLTPPPTWQCRVWPQKLENGNFVYDLLPDPLAKGELTHYKVLIGAQTALSGASGTVAQYREAAIKAGYSAIFFTEQFNQFNESQWDEFLSECKRNSDQDFICVPGYRIEDTYGGSFLVLGAVVYPHYTWLSEDGKMIKQVNKLRFGNPFGMLVIDRPGSSLIHPKMHKFYHAISVYTYDNGGILVDRGFNAWQWSAASDSNPIPIAVHQVQAPEQVQLAMSSGYQQILPAPDIELGVSYFRAATNVYFETPLRHYLSEGPILTGWSIFNKDLGKAEWNRKQYRIAIEVKSDTTLKQVRLVDRFKIAGRWLPDQKQFSTTLDGPHNEQHLYFLQATDVDGKGLLSPVIRTVCQNYRLRCGDRQNWLGTNMTVYTGTPFHNFPNYKLPIENTNEGSLHHDRVVGSGSPAPILDFPFFSNQYQINEVEINTRYHNARMLDVCYDSKPMYSIRPSDWVDARMRMFSANPQKRKDFDVALVTVDIKLKRDALPEGNPKLWPVLATATKGNNLLILPEKEPSELATVLKVDGKKMRKQKGDTANMSVDLPVGTYAGGIIPLTKGLRLYDREIGFPAPTDLATVVPRDTSWQAQFLIIKGGQFLWRGHFDDWSVDELAERAQQEMGFAGQTPYRFEMKNGYLNKIAYIAGFKADNGGIAGKLHNPNNHDLLYEIPLQIADLSDRISVALWRSDQNELTYFATMNGVGYVPLNADKTVDFYAGQIVNTNTSLFVRPVIWNAKEAWFRINNPTDQPITTHFKTVSQIQGYCPVDRMITVPAGSDFQIKELKQ